MADYHQVEMSHSRLQQETAAFRNSLETRSWVVVISSHCLVIGGICFADCIVGPGPVALGVPPPLAVLCAHFGRHRWKTHHDVEVRGAASKGSV